MSQKREIYFHEDDYCQQQLLPGEMAEYAVGELERIERFAQAHRAPGGLGWTDVYARREAPVELRALRIQRGELAEIVGEFLPAFAGVYTGYSFHREHCRRTAAWGRSGQCALFADWNEEEIIANAWAEFFEGDDESVLAATNAVAALGRRYPLIYVDWAWRYVCEARDGEAFASMLRNKLQTIAKNST